MTTNATPRYHTPHCERLESRDTPSGNVAATLSNGVLFLSGDAFDNQFSVQQNPNGDLFVIGLNGTTVNGLPSLYLGAGTLSGLAIDPWLGNDYVEILGVATPGSIWAVGNEGNDGLFVGGVTTGALFLDGQNGNDGIVTSTVFVGSFAEVSGGAGFDGYDIDQTVAPWLFIHDFESVS
jgi:hypothetical protein